MRNVYLNHQLCSTDKKLAWVNNQYMKTKDTDTVFELALPHLIKANLIPENLLKKIKNGVENLLLYIKKK